MTAYSKKVIIKLEKNKNKKMHILKSNTSIIKRIAFTKEKQKKKKKNKYLKISISIHFKSF